MYFFIKIKKFLDITSIKKAGGVASSKKLWTSCYLRYKKIYSNIQKNAPDRSKNANIDANANKPVGLSWLCDTLLISPSYYNF
jgi:hypothetical protein